MFNIFFDNDLYAIEELLASDSTPSLDAEEWALLHLGEDLAAEEELDFSEGC